MDINKLTIKSQEALERAQQITLSNGQQIIETAHLLKGIMEVDENVTPYLFKKLGVNIDRFNDALDRIISTFPAVTGGDVQYSRSATTTINKSFTYLKEFNDEFVSIEHLLIALIECYQ